jgi:MFS family permease
MNLGALGSDAGWPDPVRSWYMVLVLTLAYTFSFIDRQILNLLVAPIRRDMEISDFQMSLLLGTAFGVFYAVMGLPLSRWIDRLSRRNIIFIGISVWSLMTAACGMARTYAHLFLARVGVGVGEAALNPSAFSLLSDTFPEKKRALPTAIFHLGIPFGTGLALIIGGYVVDAVARLDPSAIPFFNLSYSWQLTFLLVGLPGLIVAALVLTFSEPRRRGLIATGKPGAERRQAVPITDVARFMLARKLAYCAIFFGIGMKITLSYGSNAWVPTHFIRAFNWTAGEFGVVYGLFNIVVGVASILLCGMVANKLLSRGIRDANMKVILFGYALGIPFAIAAPLVESPSLAIGLFMVTYFFTNFHVLAPACLVAITPNQMRGQATALYVFIVNILGLGLGPSVVAGFTDFVFGSDLALGKSLAATAAILGPLGFVVLYLGLVAYRRCLKDALAWEQEGKPAETQP